MAEEIKKENTETGEWGREKEKGHLQHTRITGDKAGKFLEADSLLRKRPTCEKDLLHEGTTCPDLRVHKPGRRDRAGASGGGAGGGEGKAPPC